MPKILVLSFYLIALTISVYAHGEKKSREWKPEPIILPQEIRETSGLIYIDSTLLTMNDSGNEPIIYRIQPQTGEIIQRLRIENAQNQDWEDLAYDGRYLYIGDFGNNLGKREDLTIYKVDLSLLSRPDSDYTLVAEKINFELPEKFRDPQVKSLKTNSDMETMVFNDSSLYIMSKEWTSGWTHIFRLDTSIGSQEAVIVDSIDISAMLTGGDYYGGDLVLCSYDMLTNAKLWFVNWADMKIKESIKLGKSTRIGQIEAVAIAPNGIYISGEEIDLFGMHSDPKLYFYPLQNENN